MKFNSGERFIRILLITIVSLIAVLMEAQANPYLHDGVYRPNEPGNSMEDLLSPVYLYQEQSMMTVNWMYIGFAPRINDPNRIKVIISKQGFSMRVRFEMTQDEVIRYPDYLLARVRELDAKLAQHGVGYNPGTQTYYQMQFEPSELYARFAQRGYMEIPQLWRLNEFRQTIERKVRPLAGNRDFTRAYDLIKEFYPGNVTEAQRDTERLVVGHFVYPLTITKHGLQRPMESVFPQAGIYRTYALDERRSIHNEYKDGQKTGRVLDDLFNGLPAFWIDPNGKGTGVHGPIRYSEPHDMGGNMPQFWAENNYLQQHQGMDPTLGLENVRFRFEVIRTANSEACFRSEPMELRHLLPSNPEAVKQVVFEVIDDFDTIGNWIVDVNYFTDYHYRRAEPMAWYRKHFLTLAEKTFSEEVQTEILDDRLSQTYTFPYLDPASLEFHIKKYTLSPFALRAYNNARADIDIYEDERAELVNRYNRLQAEEPNRIYRETWNAWRNEINEIATTYHAMELPPEPVRPTQQGWYSNPAANVMGHLNQIPTAW